jgi:hypothetical protein
MQLRFPARYIDIVLQQQQQSRTCRRRLLHRISHRVVAVRRRR